MPNSPLFFSQLFCKLVLFAVLGLTSLAHAMPSSVANSLSKARVAKSSMSLLVADLDSGNIYASHLANKKRLPASTLKLVTTLAALDALGSEFRWRTGVYTNGHIKNGVLKGDLIIKGSGDPKLVLERMVILYDTLKAKGVQRIAGDIILDRRVFSGIPQNTASFDGKPLKPYNVAPDGLLTNFSAMVFKFYPDPASGVAYVAHEPEVAGMSFAHSVPLAKKKSCGDWRGKLGARFSANSVKFLGSYPAGCGERHWPVAYPNPNRFAPRVFEGMWQLAGGELTGKARYGKLPKKARYLFDLPSLTLSQLIHDINHFSNNVMTEQVFLSLPLYAPKGTHVVSNYAISRIWLKRWWQKHIDQDVPRFTKASGLCRDCYVSTSQLMTVLQLAHTHKDAAVFKQSLGIAGFSGTIKSFGRRMPNSPAVGRAYIKTGTLNDVAAVAGFVDAVSGKRLAVVGIINTPSAKRAKPALDALLDWAARR